MLKTIKYEFKQIRVIIFALIIGMTIFTALAFGFVVLPMWIFDPRNSEVNNIWSIVVSTLSLLGYGLIIWGMTIGIYLFFGLRFYNTMYSSKGYLTHALPLKPHELILGKIIPAIITQIFAGLLVCVSAILIIGGYFINISGFYEARDNLFELIRFFVGSSLFQSLNNGILLSMAVIMIISSVCSITMLLFMCASVGQLFNSNRVLMGIISFIVINRVFSGVEAILKLLLDTFLKAFDMEGINIFAYSHLILSIVLSLILFIACYFISNYIIRNKLNLE